MKTYQIIEMPKVGKEKGVCQVVPVFDVNMDLNQIEIPNCCNIEKVIIFFGDLIKTKKSMQKLKEKQGTSQKSLKNK